MEVGNRVRVYLDSGGYGTPRTAWWCERGVGGGENMGWVRQVVKAIADLV